MSDNPYADAHRHLIGWHDDMPNADYHASPGLSKSTLDLAAKSINHMLCRREIRVETDAMILGTAVHTAVLENPQNWNDEYICGPDCDKRQRPWADAQEEASATGKILLRPEDYYAVEEIVDSVFALNDPAVSAIAGFDGTPEGSLFLEHAQTGALIKCRPDYIVPDKRLIIDLKTTKDASPESFAKSCGQFRYDVQAAMYTDMCAHHFGGDNWEFVFIAVENKAPFNAAVYTIDPTDINTARIEYASNINKVIQWYEGYVKNKGYNEGRTTLNIPRYFRRAR